MLKFHDHGYGHFNAKRCIEPSCWDWFDLLWLHSGRIKIFFQDQPPQIFKSNQGVLVFPHTPFEGHTLTPSSRASIQHFAITAPKKRMSLLKPFDNLIGKQQGYQRYTLLHTEAFDEMVANAMQLAAMKQTPLIHDLRIAQLTLILGELELAQHQQPQPGPHQDRLATLLQKIQQHPEQTLSLKDMADYMNLSISHFRALFRDRVGQTPGQFQLQVRMTEAARLLRETDWPIKRISQHLDFEEIANFYRRFKAIHNQTPRHYRDHHTPRA